VRTARDWRDGVRKVNNTRIRSDGAVITYGDGGRYNHPMTLTVGAEPPVISSRYLSLQDRLAIADRRSAGESMTAIAKAIGKSIATVSREISSRSVEGLYCRRQLNTDQCAATES
jgi:hypothetical protein